MGNTFRCPKCNGPGSKDPDVKHQCRRCVEKEICVQCGKPAYKYLEKSPYHSWYCQFHYEDKVGITNFQVIPPENNEKCCKCGEPAYSYFEASPYHDWYCKPHFEEKLAEFDGGDARRYVMRDVITETPFTKTDEPIPDSDTVGLIKDRYGYET